MNFRTNQAVPASTLARLAIRTIFVLVKCALGKAYRVADAAPQNGDVISEVHSASGRYDLMMKFYLPNDADIGHFITETI